MPTLVEICEEICDRAGVPADLIDTSLLPDVDVDGFVITNQYPAAQALQALGQVYLFDVTEYDGKIWFVPRGQNSLVTISEGSLLEDEEESDSQKRGDAISIPRTLHLSYYDIDTDALSPQKQSSDITEYRRSVGELVIDSAVVMNATLAAKTTAIGHKVMIEDQKGEVRFSLPDSYLYLTPADIIILQQEGKSERLRLQQEEIFDGYQQYIAMRDRQSAYVSVVEGIPPPVIPTPPSEVPGPTLVVPLDIPLLQDTDDVSGLAIYVAVTGFTDDWAGALVEMSRDGGANYTESRDAPVAAVIGVLTSTLGDHPVEYPDDTHSFDVQLYMPSAELTDSTLAGMLNGENFAAIGSAALGWEIINFAEVDNSGMDPTVWTISSLLRGRKYSGTREHVAGELFVLLDRSKIGLAPLGVSDIGRTLNFRATSAGEADPVDPVPVVFAGKTQTEYPVSYLTAERDGSDIIVDWQGARRLGSGFSTANGVSFIGFRVSVTDGVNTVTTDTLTPGATIDISTLVGEVTVSVSARNSLTGLGPSSEVIVP